MVALERCGEMIRSVARHGHTRGTVSTLQAPPTYLLVVEGMYTLENLDLESSGRNVENLLTFHRTE